MPDVKTMLGPLQTLPRRLADDIERRWSDARDFLDGLRIAWIPTASVLLAFWLFTAPQAQDLFLEVRGSLKIGSLYWVAFYAGIILVWVLPVYVCAHWILYRVGNEGISPFTSAATADWVRRIVPRVLAVACLAALLMGQVLALSNTPTIFDEVTQARASDLKQQFESACPTPQNVQSGAPQQFSCSFEHLNLFARYVLIELSQTAGAENVIFIVYGGLIVLPGFFLLTYLWIRMSESASRRTRTAFLVLAGWLSAGLLFWSVVPKPGYGLQVIYNLVVLPLHVFGGLAVAIFWTLLPALLRRVPTERRFIKWNKYAGLATWWILSVLMAVLIAFLLVAGIYGLAHNELDEPLGIGHLALLPTITVLVGLLVWWALGSSSRGAPARIERLLPWRAGGQALLFDDARAKAGAWNPLFWAVLAVSLVLLAYQLSLHPVEVTTHVYRALMVPFFLGLLVPVLTFVSHFSFRVHAPITALTIIAIAVVISMRPWVHDVRPAERQVTRPTLEETVQRWAAVNDCDPASTGGDRLCPQPIIVSAAGGASRAAFLVGAVIGRLMDETHDSAGNPMRPFGKQLFAISGVSGGALGAAVTYAALADTQLEPTAINGKGAPPCSRTAVDTEWFAPARERHTSWRNCLEIILSGDFLSPVFVGLISNDIFGAPFRTDRAGILEHAWERRYAHLTEQVFDDPGNPTTLDRAMVGLRHRVLDAGPSNWLPMLLLNGTSVTTGRRIIASDVDTLYTELSTQQLEPRGRLFRDAYDLHELFEAPPVQFDSVLASRDGRTLLAMAGNRLRTWDLDTGEERHAIDLPGGTHAVNAVLNPDDGRVLAVASSDNAVSVRDAATGTPLRTLQPGEANIEGLSLSPDGALLLVSYGANARLFDVASGADLCAFARDENGTGNLIAVLGQSGRQVLTREKVGALQVRNAHDCAVVRTLDTGDREYFAQGVAIDPEGRRVATAFNYSGKAAIWNVETGTIEHELEVPVWSEHESPRGVAFSADGRHVLVHTDVNAAVWRVEDGERLMAFRSTDYNRPLRPSFSPDGRHVVVILGNEARLWDSESWQLVRKLRGQEGAVKGAAFTRGGEHLLTWDDNGAVHIWDVETGMEIGVIRTSRSSLARCGTCDVRLSTAVTMSARFPVISPPGNIRNAKGQTIDRVVDGGYYENFGAISALELAEVLRNRYNLRPAIILINNEPAILGMSCISSESRLAYPEAPPSLSFATFRSSIEAMMATRSARGTLAAVELCQRVTAENFAFVSVRPDPTNPKKALTMSWWLSKHVQKYLDDQVSPTARTLNQQAFEKIRRWRTH